MLSTIRCDKAQRTWEELYFRISLFLHPGVQKGADIEAKDDNRQTTLHRAAWDGHEAVMRLLLEEGADAEAKIVRDKTALHCVFSLQLALLSYPSSGHIRAQTPIIQFQ